MPLTYPGKPRQPEDGLLSAEAVDRYEPSPAELALRSREAGELVAALASDLGPRA